MYWGFVCFCLACISAVLGFGSVFTHAVPLVLTKLLFIAFICLAVMFFLRPPGPGSHCR